MAKLTLKGSSRTREVLGVPNAVAEGEDAINADSGNGQAGGVGLELPAEPQRTAQRRVIGNMARMMAGQSFLIRNNR